MKEGGAGQEERHRELLQVLNQCGGVRSFHRNASKLIFFLAILDVNWVVFWLCFRKKHSFICGSAILDRSFGVCMSGCELLGCPNSCGKGGAVNHPATSL